MSKVSYILGAGASYGNRKELPPGMQPFIQGNQSHAMGIERGLPILQEFTDALYQLSMEVASFANVESAKKYIRSEVLEPMREISYEYPTIDTYAKMLYATKHMEEYRKFKNQLSLFFLMWQKCHRHDLRYDSFMASLIDAETCELPPMTILSWNYDMQLEMSYSKYVKDKRALCEIWDSLNVFNKTNNFLEYSVEKPFAFIKLNGSAMFHSDEIDNSSTRYVLQDVLWREASENKFWEDVCSFYDNGVQNEKNTSPKYVNELSYAWEKRGKDKLLQTISQRVADCEEVVVIGYSFPHVNREIDRHIFDMMPNLKHIYIQDKHSKVIAERITAIFEYLRKSAPVIDPKEDIDVFFIPNELG